MRGPRRSIRLVEESDALTVRQLATPHLRARLEAAPLDPEWPLVLVWDQAGRHSRLPVGPLLAPRVQRAFGGSRTITRWYLRCPQCQRYRTMLFPTPLERSALLALACRRCLRLRYQSQTHGRWDLPLIQRLEARERALRATPGPKGRRYRAWRRRLCRVQVLALVGLERVRRQLAHLAAPSKKPQRSAQLRRRLPPPTAPATPSREVERQGRALARQRFPPGWSRGHRPPSSDLRAPGSACEARQAAPGPEASRAVEGPSPVGDMAGLGDRRRPQHHRSPIVPPVTYSFTGSCPTPADHPPTWRYDLLP